MKEYTVKYLTLTSGPQFSSPGTTNVNHLLTSFQKYFSTNVFRLVVYDYFPSHIYEKYLRIRTVIYFILKFSSGKMEKPVQVLPLIVLWRCFSGFVFLSVSKRVQRNRLLVGRREMAWKQKRIQPCSLVTLVKQTTRTQNASRWAT